MTSQWTDDSDPGYLEDELRADAATWQSAPSARTTARLQAAVAEVPRRTSLVPKPVLISIVAASVLLCLVVIAFSEGALEPTAQLDTPLQQELGNLATDVNTLAEAVWQQLPEPLRRLRLD